VKELEVLMISNKTYCAEIARGWLVIKEQVILPLPVPFSEKLKALQEDSSL